MAKIYVIVDIKMKCDVMPFIQNTDGAAGSFFYNWCLMQRHREFALYSIGEIGYEDGQNFISSADRNFMVNMPVEDLENA